MSADTNTAILITKDDFQQIALNHFKNLKEPITAYRVATIQAIENFSYVEENEPHNLGHYMYQYFKDSTPVYSKKEAYNLADKLEEKEATEYGVAELDYSKFNYPR